MKIFASDYDGTFYRKGKLVEKNELKRNIEAVQKWRDSGNLFVFATGRSISQMKFLTPRSNKFDYLVGLNGGQIYTGSGEKVYQIEIAEEAAREIMKIVKDMGVNKYGVTNGVYDHRSMPLIPLTKHAIYINYALLLGKIQGYVKPLDVVMKSPAQIAVVMATATEAIELANYINKNFDKIATAFANNNYVDISGYGVSKATGIAEIVKLHDVSDGDVYVMGDSYNDLPMIEKYTAYCPENSVEDVKKKSEIVNTVADALEKLM